VALGEHVRKYMLAITVLFLVQTYGVYGAYRTQQLAYTCEWALGPLCYQWDEATWVSEHAPEVREKVEELYRKSKDKLNQEVVQRLMEEREREELKGLYRDAKKSAQETWAATKDSVKSAIEAPSGALPNPSSE
jgi:hypothetical protein